MGVETLAGSASGIAEGLGSTRAGVDRPFYTGGDGRSSNLLILVT